jgi:hypothetical protein
MDYPSLNSDLEGAILSDFSQNGRTFVPIEHDLIPSTITSKVFPQDMLKESVLARNIRKSREMTENVKEIL